MFWCTFPCWTNNNKYLSPCWMYWCLNMPMLECFHVGMSRWAHHPPVLSFPRPNRRKHDFVSLPVIVFMKTICFCVFFFNTVWSYFIYISCCNESNNWLMYLFVHCNWCHIKTWMSYPQLLRWLKWMLLAVVVVPVLRSHWCILHSFAFDS